MSDVRKFDMFGVIRDALNVEYARLLPEGYTVTRVAEYDPSRHTAPNLWLEKREHPQARYLVNISSNTSTVPALGETVNEALQRAIVKVEQRRKPEERQ